MNCQCYSIFLKAKFVKTKTKTKSYICVSRCVLSSLGWEEGTSWFLYTQLHLWKGEDQLKNQGSLCFLLGWGGEMGLCLCVLPWQGQGLNPWSSTRKHQRSATGLPLQPALGTTSLVLHKTSPGTSKLATVSIRTRKGAVCDNLSQIPSTHKVERAY